MDPSRAEPTPAASAVLLPAALAAAIEHTLLRPDATRADVERFAEEAVRHHFAGACVAGSWIPAVAARLRGTGVLAVGVAGFPLGTASPGVKAYETASLARAGADEIDVVVHLGHARAGDWRAVARDLRGVARAADGRPVKAILETALFGPVEVRRLAEIALDAGAAFVKTSTGFLGPGGATVEVVTLLRSVVGGRGKVKASGGIRTYAQARALLAAGADRLGTSSSVTILEEACRAPATG